MLVSFLYFLQLINNWPQMLLMTWSNLKNSSSNAIESKVDVIYENSSFIWNDVSDFPPNLGFEIRASVCRLGNDSGNDSQFHWRVFSGNTLKSSKITQTCSTLLQVSTRSNLDHFTLQVDVIQSQTISTFHASLQNQSIFWLAAIGDSFISGQGNPDSPSIDNRVAGWTDAQCFRSNKSFAFLVQRRLQGFKMFSFLSCSGASVDDGILSANGQVAKLEAMMNGAGKVPNVLLMTMGGNDIGFTDILTSFQNGNSIDDSINMRMFFVSHQLDRIGQKLRELGIPQIIIVLYYDITRNEHGKIDASCGLFGQISQANLELAERRVLRQLNWLLIRKAFKFGWKIIDTHDIFQTRGLCSKQSLIRSKDDSIRVQGNEFGSFHPNEEAHWLISDKILQVIR